MPWYEFLKYGKTVSVVDRNTNKTVVVVNENGISGNDEALEELNKMKATNESVIDFIKRSAK